MFEYPKVLDNMKEFPAIYNMNDRVNPVIDAENLELDLFIGTATAAGIARREKEYGISPKDTDSLEDRRFRIKLKENERLPYTETFLREKLTELCGADGYYLEVLADEVIVKISLGKKSFFESVADMLEKMIPLNMIIRLGLLLNTYEILALKTYEQLEGYTYQELREEVL